MNALEKLKDDHRHIKQLVRQLEKTGAGNPSGRLDLLGRIKDEMAMHFHIEEEAFLPSLMAGHIQGGEGLRQKALQEHRQIEQKLEALSKASLSDGSFEAILGELRKMIDDNAAMEETEIFPLVQRCLDPDQLKEVGYQISVKRAELFSSTMEGSDPASSVERSAGKVGEMAGEIAGRAKNTARNPARIIGRGVEEIVRVGATLAGEVWQGACRGMERARERQGK